MPGDAVELTVRFAGTLLSVTRVPRGGRFVIGTGPEVDLPIAIVTAFTLIESVASGFRLRVPVGVHARALDYPHQHVEGAFVLAKRQRVLLAIGLVTIAVEHVVDAIAPVPRPPVSKRMVPYFAAVLAAQVALVAVAMATSQVEEPITIPVVVAKPPPPLWPKHVPVKPPRPDPEQVKQKRAKQAQQAAAAAAVAAVEAAQAPPGGAAPEPQQRAVQAVREGAYFGGITREQIAALTGSVDIAQALAEAGALYDPEGTFTRGFGGSAGAFDPTNDPRFDSVKTGPLVIGGKQGADFKLPAHGRFREVDRPPLMGLTCDDDACTTVGELDRKAVRDHVETRYVDMLKCFERYGRREQRIEVTLRFEIASDGHAREVTGGATAFGQCIERLVERTRFPAAKPTQVTAYPIAFWRNG